MSKIICDVCGTSYPDTAAQCPICGCAKPADAASFDSSADNVTETAAAYTYVKGGRFSKSNVRKRNKSNQAQPVRSRNVEMNDAPDDNGSKSNKGLVITVLVLLLAIVAVVIYIAVRFFLPAYSGFGGGETTTAATTTAPTTEEMVDDGLIHCTGLNVTDSVITFSDAGQAWKLNVLAEPADTTDVITYASSDEAVATVSEEGIVTAVGTGEANITITCGTVVVECQVICTIETEPSTEAPTVPETTVPETTVPETTTPREYSMRINGSTRKSYDVTIKVGGAFTLTITDQDGNVVDVDWENSGPSYVSVTGNTVKGKAPTKYVKISTELDGKIYECVVRVSG